jgi:hypothetical protein
MITEQQFLEAKDIIQSYKNQQLQKMVIQSDICNLNRIPNDCSVNLYTQAGCKTCRYYKGN